MEWEGFAFKVEVQYERRPRFCHYCYVIGHNVATCKWLHPDAATEKPDRVKKPMVAEMNPRPIPTWQPHEHHSDVGASTSTQGVTGTSLAIVDVAAPSSTTTVVIQGQTISHSATHITDVAANSFSFALHNVSDEIPQGTLPQPFITVLELVFRG